MSFQIRNIREIPGDPLAKFANELSKKLSRFITKDQLDLLDDREDNYIDGQDFDTVLRLHDELLSTKQFDFLTQYFPPMEPDLDKLTLWLRGRNSSSNEMTDWSGFSNGTAVNGDPLLIDGTPFDYGLHTGGVKSLALKFNRPTSTFDDDIRVTDNTRIRIFGTSTGISYFIRFRIHSLAQHESRDRRIFEKVDDTGWTTNPTNGVMLVVTTEGSLYFTVRRSGNNTEKQTDAGTITTDTVYDVWITRDQATQAIKIYVNNVDKTLTNGSQSFGWHAPNTDMNLCIMGRGGTETSGHTYGDLYDFRIYREKIVSPTEVSRFHTNKWSISNIPFGQVLIANYWATYLSVSAKSFTGSSFTSASFEV